MIHSFWQQLERPFTALAPMSGVTDHAFRIMIAKYGKPDVIYTEFVPADGLCSPGFEHLRYHLLYSEDQRPIVAQIYGSNPSTIRGASRIVAELGFDGVDINMGCPAKPLERRGGGAALIKTPDLALELIRAAKEGAGPMPVSVKTRIGYNRDETESWIASLIKAQPAAIAIHARTRTDKTSSPARWQAINRAVELAREMFADPDQRPLVIGNGDVTDLNALETSAGSSGCDGVMCGRATYGNPWFFNKDISRSDLALSEVLGILGEHVECYYRIFNGIKPIEILKKHFKSYLAGFHSAGITRKNLMQSRSYDEVRQAIAEGIAMSAASDPVDAR